MIKGEDAARAYVAQRCSPEALDKMERFGQALLAESKNQNLIANKY